MDDYSIVRDDYFYIKEQAFKHLGGVKNGDSLHGVREEQGHAQENAEEFKKEENTNDHDKPETIQAHSRHLNCPVHNEAMKKIRLGTVMIDYCPVCFGIWLDFGELEQLMNKKITKDIFFTSKLLEPVADHSQEKSVSKNCPVCKKTLHETSNRETNTLLDICEICGGIWFDSGEFARVYLESKDKLSTDAILAGVVGKYIDIKI
ncbi:MAG: zf-TFIIB domain-containing protein [Spirochaetales bacterium]|nr:zf-TFIIB domain-containing protein [Spirochaetales bacterium]